jgi:hypothetical protein
MVTTQEIENLENQIAQQKAVNFERLNRLVQRYKTSVDNLVKTKHTGFKFDLIAVATKIAHDEINSTDYSNELKTTLHTFIDKYKEYKFPY